MTDKPTPTDSEIDALWRFEASKNWDSTLAMRTSFTRAVLAKWGQPSQAAEPVATQWLAEMIMSDCGCSTENQRLLDRIIDRIQQYDRASAAPQPSTAAQEDALSDAVRVPLDSLHADAAYLIGRLREGSMPYARVIEIIRERIDAAKAAIRARAAHGQAPADLSPTAGMNIAQRILHVGGRNNDAGYVEFGSIQAVEALVRQVLRDLPAPAQADSVLEDAERLAWMADGWTPGNEKLYVQHVLETGGVGDVDDLRTFIDKQIAANGGSK